MSIRQIATCLLLWACTAGNAAEPAAAAAEESLESGGEERATLFGGSVRLFQHSLQYQVAGDGGGLVNNRLRYALTLENAYEPDWLVRVDARAHVFLGRDHQARARDDAVAARPEIRDLYVQKNFGDTAVKLGRQYVVWTEMEALGFLNDLNPRDFNEFTYPTITDSQVSQTRLVVDHYASGGRLTAFVTPVSSPNIRAKRGSAYDIEGAVFDASRFAIRSAERHQPEFGLRYFVSTERSDVGLIYARLVDNDALYGAGTPAPGDGRVPLERRYGAYDLFALSANRSFGRWTARTEIGYERGRSFQAANDALAAGRAAPRRDQIDVVVAGEYLTQSNSLIHAEYSERHIRHWSEDIGRRKVKREFFFLLRGAFLRDLLDAEYTWYRELHDRLDVHRLKLSYEIDDRLRIGAQFDYFKVPRHDVLPLAHPNRVTLSLTYQL